MKKAHAQRLAQLRKFINESDALEVTLRRDTVRWLFRRISTLSNECEALQHDIARHVQRDTDRLAELAETCAEVERLREALRGEVITNIARHNGTGKWCQTCGQSWDDGELEYHAPQCLAALGSKGATNG